MTSKLNAKKIMIVVLLVLLAVISATRVSPWASDPENHRYSIEKTDEKIAAVMTLSGGSAATSATLSLLPGDICTPIAQELAELAKYFLLILSSLYLEKFLISLSGYITFMCLIPLACVLLAGAILTEKTAFARTAGKIALVGIVIYLIVPASVRLSDMVYQTQAAKVNDAIDQYNDLEIGGDTDGGIISEFTSITTETIDHITDFVEDLMESLAVMVVTSCVIPVLVFVFLIWLVKVIFSANILTLDSSVVEAIAKRIKG